MTQANSAWLHVCTNGKKLVSTNYLDERYDNELRDCIRMKVELKPTGNNEHEYKYLHNEITEVRAIDERGNEHGIFYMHN